MTDKDFETEGVGAAEKAAPDAESAASDRRAAEAEAGADTFGGKAHGESSKAKNGAPGGDSDKDAGADEAPEPDDCTPTADEAPEPDDCTPTADEKAFFADIADTAELKKYSKKKRGVSVWVCVTVGLLCCLATFMATYAWLYNLFSKKDADTSFITRVTDKLRVMDATVRSEYLYDIDDDALIDGVMKGYMSSLGDRYADYYNTEEYNALMDSNNGEMQGIGISIVYDSENNALQVISVFPDSPALEAGLKPGDRIAYVKIDGETKSVAELGYQASVSAMQGKAGTVAEFIAYREGDYTNPIEYSVTRGYVTEVTASGRMYSADSEVGIIRITSFDAKTPDQFAAALKELQNKGAKKLIIDVRNNPGGELMSVCKVLDSLLPEGPVIRTVDRDGNEEVVYTSDAAETDMPMAVIVNGNTASAGELFTAALMDYDKAVSVGTTTFGKGSMQTIRSFTDGTGLKYTYRYYCPPYSDNYDGVGITPDIPAELSEAAASKNIYTLTDEEDSQLTAAYDALK